MENWHPQLPYLFLAIICGAASTAIVFFASMVLSHGGHMSDAGMYSIAGMTVAPAIMGIGIAGFMSRDKR